MATIKELSDGGPDGTRLGQSATDKVGFFGTPPIVKPTVAAASSSVATTTILETRVADIITALAALGLVNNG